MTTKQLLEKELHDAMRASDDVRKRTIRMVLTNLKLSEVEKKAPLEELEIITLIQKEIKMRRETIRDAEKAGRADMKNENLEEIKVLESFLPKQLSEEEVIALIRQAIQDTQATGLSDMGKVMKQVLPIIKGKASNDLVSKLVRELLSS